MVVCSIVHLCLTKKGETQIKQKNQQKLAENISQYLLFSTKQETLKIFENVLKKKNCEYTKKTNFICFNDNALYPVYTKTKCDDNDILECIVKLNTAKISATNIIILAKTFTDDAIKFSKTLSQKVILMNEYQTYELFFKPVNFIVENKSQKKLSFKQKSRNLIDIAFNKKRFKNYMISALIVFIGSYFMRYNIYYLIMSTILIILALFSYFNKPFNRPQKDIFDNKKNSHKTNF